MKKTWKILAATLALTTAFGALAACGTTETSDPADTSQTSDQTSSIGGNSTNSGNSSNSTNSGNSGNSNNSGSSSDGSSDVTPPVRPAKLPSAEKVVAARKKAAESTKQGYDFHLNIKGKMDAFGLVGEAQADYKAQYRYDSTTDELAFKRVTSGLLLYDSTEYLYTNADQRVKITANDKGKVKKVEDLISDEQELMLVNKPMVALVDSLEVYNLTNIRESDEYGYAYATSLSLGFDNPVLTKVVSLLGKLGTAISIKNVTFDNPVGGIQMYFNMNGDLLEDFKYTATLSFECESVTTQLTLTYEQTANAGAVEIPSSTHLTIDRKSISDEVSLINAELLELKNSETYSLDVEAKNDFDPSWNKLATVDSYLSRLYKHTDESNVWFNHSYKYKTHHESDGKENYEYAIGNAQDGETYLASYKGKNTYTPVKDTVDQRFDYILSPVLQDANVVDCLLKETKGSKTTYTLYLNKKGAASVQKKIIDMINSNAAEGVVKVENYLGESFRAKEAEVVVTIENSKITELKAYTELRYYPVDGECTEYNAELKNEIVFKINDKLKDAQKYIGPKNEKLDSIL